MTFGHIMEKDDGLNKKGDWITSVNIAFEIGLYLYKEALFTDSISYNHLQDVRNSV